MTASRKRLVYSAKVAQSNTPETDAMPEVMHKVWCEGVGGVGECNVLVMAADPLEAIDKVACMSDAEFAGLKRAESD